MLCTFCIVSLVAFVELEAELSEIRSSGSNVDIICVMEGAHELSRSWKLALIMSVMHGLSMESNRLSA